jgi:hypothetical protein
MSFYNVHLQYELVNCGSPFCGPQPHIFPFSFWFLKQKQLYRLVMSVCYGNILLRILILFMTLKYILHCANAFCHLLKSSEPL